MSELEVHAVTPEGYEWVPEPVTHWRVATPEETASRGCRFGRVGTGEKACGRPPVGACHRSNGWWLYCQDHLYGRRVEGGQVLFLRRAVES